mmetsp:Transcript_73076/g.133780  ORF Transcript_73076/g.133780 Transcript_73076/m.133780 type:complete len:788 (+) Transcript_73076:139-2502(+)
MYVLDFFDASMVDSAAARVFQAATWIFPIVFVFCAIAHACEVCAKWWTGAYIVHFVVDKKEGLAFRSSKSTDESVEIQEHLADRATIDGYKENDDWVRVLRKWPLERKRYLPINLDGKRVLPSLQEMQEKKKKLEKMEAELMAQPMPAEKASRLYEKVEELKKIRRDGDAKETTEAGETPIERRESWSASAVMSRFIPSLFQKDSETVEEVEKPEVVDRSLEEPEVEETVVENSTTAEIQSPEFTSIFLVDNTHRKSSDHGVAYRVSKNLNDKREGVLAKWGTFVSGNDDGFGWVQTEQGFLPKSVHGVQVLVLQDPASGNSAEAFSASVAEHMEAEGLEVDQSVRVIDDKEKYELECQACHLAVSEMDEKLGQSGKILTLAKEDGTAKLDNHIGWVPIKCLARPAGYYRIDNSQLKAATDGLGLRNSKNLEDKHPHDMAEWGHKVWATQEDDQWIKVGNRFLPIFSNGVRVIVKCDPAEAHYIVDNSELKAQTDGLAYRIRKEWDAKVDPHTSKELAIWYSYVDGVEEDDEWLRVPGADRTLFLPLFVRGIRVIRRWDEAQPAAEHSEVSSSSSKKASPSFSRAGCPCLPLRAASQPLRGASIRMQVEAELPVSPSTQVEASEPLAASSVSIAAEQPVSPSSEAPAAVEGVAEVEAEAAAAPAARARAAPEAEEPVKEESAEAASPPTALEAIAPDAPEEGECYLVDAHELFPDGPDPFQKGLMKRLAKSNEMEHATQEHVKWGEYVRGVDEGDGWIRLGSDRFLPTHREGKQVLFLQETVAAQAL